MKKLLLISYMFPPIAGSGIQRPLKFVKYLPSFQVTPIVFCPRNAKWKAYDENNLKLPFLQTTQIYRGGVHHLRRYYRIRFDRGKSHHPYFYLLALKYIWFMDYFSAWYFECRKEVARIAASKKVDCVMTTSPPHSTHLFGFYLKNKMNLPWIMDLRDAMVDDPNPNARNLANRIQKSVENFHEGRFYAQADAIVTVSPPIADSLQQRHPGLDLSGKTHVITNGFDEADFDAIPISTKKRKYLQITYTGSFPQKRTPVHFLQAVRNLIRAGSVEPSDLRICFAGYFDSSTDQILKEFAGQLPLEVKGFQPFSESLRLQMESDLLLLIVTVAPGEDGSQMYTGKFFEYVGARRPIFALAPPGPLKQTIEDGRFGVVAPPTDIDKIADAFEQLYRKWKRAGTVEYNPDLALRSRFTRRQLTEELAAIVHQCSERFPSN